MEERDRGVPRLGRRDSGAAGTGGGAPGGLRGRARAVAGLGKWGRTGRAAAVAEQLWGVVCGSGSTGRGAEGNCGHRRHLKGSSTSSVVSKGSQMALVKISYVVSFSSQEIQGGEATEDLPVEAGRGCLEPNPPQPLCLDGAEAQSWHEHPGGSPELLAKDVGAPAVPGLQLPPEGCPG
ncbi:uncharacterized protein LOC120513383 isoform X6 [Passer montanus]|uniref:uncharacterized protein LOC120513383 isoform X6 n=1 Tax=Passer montanus TaxID=9160 RepID=UPI001961B83B|nr:uncharacterized protein LOC120513383 isoform X6 [Passer montanus]